MTNSYRCSICHDPYSSFDVYKVSHNAYPGGKHLFCAQCIVEWLKTSETCPVCWISMKASDLRQYRNPEFSWKNKIVNYICTRQAGGEYQLGIFKTLLRTIYFRLDENKYVPVVTEGMGLYEVSVGGCMLTFGVAMKILSICKGVEGNDNQLFGPSFLVGAGKNCIAWGTYHILKLPILPFEMAWKLR